MRKKRDGLFSGIAIIGVVALGVVGFYAANRNPRESAVVLSSIPQTSVLVSENYESSVNSVSSVNPVNPVTYNEVVTTDKPYLINLNTATSRQLQTLSGIGEAKAAAIIEYRETHGGFFDVSELLNVSGIGEQTYENIRSYITVGDVPPKEPPQSSAGASSVKPTQNPVEIPAQIPQIPIVNINTASLEELQKLPGIGSAKAMAIVQYRSVFGEFYDISEIKNVNGIGESVFEEIRDYITVGAVSPRLVEADPPEADIPDTSEDIFVDLNTATLSELCKIPGIGSAKARAIIEYREENGWFYDIGEIKNVSGIGEKLFESIEEYIYVEQRERPSSVQNPEPEASKSENPSPNEPSASYPVNLNTATLEEFCTLPGINEAKAEAILQYRSNHGGFSDIREIRNVKGIGDNTFTKLRYLITV